MQFSYGEGEYLKDKERYTGRIVLSQHKVHVRDASGDVASSFVPLEKITAVRLSGNSVQLDVRPSLYFQYVACFRGEKKHMKELAGDIAQRRGMKKKFLKNEWIEVND